MSILEGINSPRDLKSLDYKDLDKLSQEIRELIIDVVSKNGGHLAPSLGVVELTIALHKAFDTPKDKIIWDVGHQVYAHKILTGRKDKFHTLRQFKGISGFPKRSESEYDTFNTGHSSTSISLGVGLAVARDLKGEDYNVVCVIGDGAMTAGLAFEGLNNAGVLKSKMIVVLNDNRMSIDENVGAISNYLNKILITPFYNRIKHFIGHKVIKRIPFVGQWLFNFLERLDASIKGIILPGLLFEKLGFRYLGPFDGHNIKELVAVFEKVKKMDSDRPILVHVITKKGKGYLYAEQKPSRFHGVGPFLIKTGDVIKKKEFKSFSEAFGDMVVELAEKDRRIVAITAAMREGTGLLRFSELFPERFFDVGIAEQHAITFSGALASAGLIPFVSIYSTFLQRAYDQLIHDVGLMNLPIRLVIDRGGVVGEDGETHHGIYDLVFMRTVPNFISMVPKDIKELRDMIYTAYLTSEHPTSIRIPREVELVNGNIGEPRRLPVGKAEVLREGEYIAIFSLGRTVKIAKEVANLLERDGYNPSIVNLRFIKPMDISTILNIAKSHSLLVSIEDGVVDGGIGSAILSVIKDIKNWDSFIIKGYNVDSIIPQGRIDELLKYASLDPESIYEDLLNALKKKTNRFVVGRPGDISK